MTLASIISAMTAAGCTAEQIGAVMQTLSSGTEPALSRIPRAALSAMVRDAPPPLEILKTVLTAKTAQAVIDHRKAKKAPLTPRAAELLVAAFRDHGDCEAAADTMIANCWRGFRSEWMSPGPTFANGHGRSNGNEGFVKSVLEDIEHDRRRRREEGSAKDVPMLFNDRERH